MINWIFTSLFALTLGFLLDLLIGDPHFLYHPIRLVGNLISWLEKRLRKMFPKTEKGELTAGALLVVLVILITCGGAFAVLWAASFVGVLFQFLIETIMCYQLLATKALKTESMKVYRQLKKKDLTASRRAVSMIVGRDTDALDMEGVAKAAVETVAENTSDGIIAPLLFLILGGPVFGYFYKAINTMDSMVGYKNEKYLYFGRAAAKLDDAVNFIPARISAWLMIGAAPLVGLNGREGRRIFLRDRFHHASPNSAQTEAVMAGALGVQLAGDAWYFGKKYQKPTIGDRGREVEAEDIPRANHLLYASAGLALLLFGLLKFSAGILLRFL